MEKNDPTPAKRKHVPRACLECRRKHLKCDSVEPQCVNCSTPESCIYIASHRGGFRIKRRKSNDREDSRTLVGLTEHIHGDATSRYYRKFHHLHPFIPSGLDGQKYFSAINSYEDLVFAMIMVCDQQCGQQLEMFEKILHDKPVDLIRLQSLVLMIIYTQMHFKQKSAYFRQMARDQINASIAHEQKFYSKRLCNADTELLESCIRMAVHELYLLDVMMSAGDGCQCSLINKNLVSSIPDFPAFSWHVRFECVSIVSEITHLLNSLHTDNSLLALQAKVSAMQEKLRLGNDQYALFVDRLGQVNEAIFYAVMALNFGSILLHWPISEISHYSYGVSCTPSQSSIHNNGERFMNNSTPIVTFLSEQQRIINTQKCMTAASNITELAMNIEIKNVANRTPLYTCSLALAFLVHVKSYQWIQQQTSNVDKQETIELIQSLMVVSYQSLNAIGESWYLARRLNEGFSELIQRHLPEIYKTVTGKGLIGISEQVFVAMDLQEIGLDFLDEFLAG